MPSCQTGNTTLACGPAAIDVVRLAGGAIQPSGERAKAVRGLSASCPFAEAAKPRPAHPRSTAPDRASRRLLRLALPRPGRALRPGCSLPLPVAAARPLPPAGPAAPTGSPRSARRRRVVEWACAGWARRDRRGCPSGREAGAGRRAGREVHDRNRPATADQTFLLGRGRAARGHGHAADRLRGMPRLPVDVAEQKFAREKLKTLGTGFPA